MKSTLTWLRSGRKPCRKRPSASSVKSTSGRKKKMKNIDRIYLEAPFYGSRKILTELKKQNYIIGRKRVQRLTRLMGLRAIYRRPRTRKPGKGNKIYPYLLRELNITRPN